MKEILEFIKGIVRPAVIFWAFGMWTYCFINQIQIPWTISAPVTAVIVEYWGERAIKRFKEVK